jgi:hypothetical protein
VGTADHGRDLVGDEWAKRAREACVAFVTGFREDTASVGVRLLSDLRDVFDADEVRRRRSATRRKMQPRP